jgi:hypothetical protein
MNKITELEFTVHKCRGEHTGMFVLKPLSVISEADITRLTLQGFAKVKVWGVNESCITRKVL